MADNVVGRTVIQIVGDTSQYNTSIDSAVQNFNPHPPHGG